MLRETTKQQDSDSSRGAIGDVQSRHLTGKGDPYSAAQVERKK